MESGYDKQMVEDFLDEIANTKVKEIPKCTNKHCLVKTNCDDPSRINLKNLKYSPGHCEANAKLLEAMMELADRIALDEDHSADISNIQREEQLFMRETEVDGAAQ